MLVPPDAARCELSAALVVCCLFSGAARCASQSAQTLHPSKRHPLKMLSPKRHAGAAPAGAALPSYVAASHRKMSRLAVKFARR
jgi:hypothetical protein